MKRKENEKRKKKEIEKKEKKRERERERGLQCSGQEVLDDRFEEHLPSQ